MLQFSLTTLLQHTKMRFQFSDLSGDMATKKIKEPPLAKHVQSSLERYFADMNGEKPSTLYHMVMREVEAPLLKVVMHETNSNQSKAAEILGINRNTLRKKLKTYGLQ